MRKITLLFFVLAALMAVLGSSTALGDLARILFAAFGALCVISLAISIAPMLDDKPRV